jgi:hypothetical protein
MDRSRPLFLILIMLLAVLGYVYLSRPAAQPDPVPAPTIAPVSR